MMDFDKYYIKTGEFPSTRQGRHDSRVEAVLRMAQFRSDAEDELELKRLPEKVRELIWNKAWEDGHSHGFSEVYYHYEDLAEIALAATPPTQETPREGKA